MSEPSASRDSCPSPGVILGVLDVDPAAREASPTMAHVRQCAACLEQLDDFEWMLDELAVEFDACFAMYDDAEASKARKKEFERRLREQEQRLLTRPIRQPRRLLPLVAAILVFALGFGMPRMRSEAVLSANELLQRAEHVESDRRITPLQPLHVTFTGARPDAVLTRLFGQGQHWAAPVSIASIRRWQQQMGADAQSKVIVPSGESDRLILSITASRGELRQARLEFQRTSFRVMVQTFVFADGGMLKIGEGASTGRSPGLPALKTEGPTPSGKTPEPSSPSSVAAHARPGLAAFVERTFVANGEGQKFVPELRSLTASLAGRFKELRALASDPGPDADAKALVCYEAMREDLNALELMISVIFGATTRSLPLTDLPADWRRRVTDASAHWIRLERFIDTMLTHDDVLPDDAEIPLEFSALWETLHETRQGR